MSAFGGKALLSDRRAVTPRVSLSLARMRGLFSPLWPPLPCFQKRQGSFPAVRTDNISAARTRRKISAHRAAKQLSNSLKVAEPEQVAALGEEVGRLEQRFNIPAGTTELAPNIESARGIVCRRNGAAVLFPATLAAG